MAAKQHVRALLRKQLGKDAADALLNKVDRMAKRGANAANIEKVFLADLGAHLEKRISNFMVQAVSGVRPLVAVRSRNAVIVRSGNAVAVRSGKAVAVRSGKAVAVRSGK